MAEQRKIFDCPPDVPRDLLERNPLITPAAFAHLNSIVRHPDAPVWNYPVGDRVRREDLAQVDLMRRDLRANRCRGTGRPPGWLCDWVRSMRARVPLFRRFLPEGFDVERDWGHIPTMCREDIVSRLEDIVPQDEDLSRLIVYETSGVTGHAIKVPHHPLAMAKNHVLIESALGRFGVFPRFREGAVACLNVGAQFDTVLFATVFSVWDNAGFAKVSLHSNSWDPVRASRFFRDMKPAFLTGDPLGFAGLLNWNIEVRPSAMISTAVELNSGLKSELKSSFGCPVIDTYATTETGMVACDNPEGEGMNIIPHDIYVEIVDEDGVPLPEGRKGEICVSGGRNPYLPLLRYRTGDSGRLVWSSTVESDPAPRLLDLEARKAVCFRGAGGAVISPVDIGRIIRQWVFVQHQFVQKRDGSCSLVIRPVHGCPVDAAAMAIKLKRIFGPSTRIDISIDDELGRNNPGGKVEAFKCELDSSWTSARC